MISRLTNHLLILVKKRQKAHPSCNIYIIKLIKFLILTYAHLIIEMTIGLLVQLAQVSFLILSLCVIQIKN